MLSKEHMELEHTRGFRLSVALSVLIVMILSVLAGMPAGDAFEKETSLRLAFTAREFLGRSPRMDDRLKVLALDDRAVSTMGQTDLSPSQWQTLLKSMSDSAVRAVVIDKVFAVADRDVRFSSRNAPTSEHPTRIYSAAFSKDTPIYGRDDLQDAAYQRFELKKFVEAGGNSEWSWLGAQKGFVYGPNPKWQPLFTSIGHFAYGGHGTVVPAIRVNPSTALPHVGLRASYELTMNEDGITADGHRIPLDHQHRIVVNYPTTRSMFQSTLSLSKFVSNINQRLPNDQFQAGDVVVILPQLFTGAADFMDTPIGRMPAGFSTLAIVNSVLTGDWLREIGHPALNVIAFGVLALFFSYRLPTTKLLSLLSLGLVTTVAVSLGMFAYASAIWPWMIPASAGVAVVGIAMATRLRFEAERTRTLREALGTSVDAGHLNRLLRNPQQIELEASERVVTILFLDVASFSLTAERQSPKEIFEALKEITQASRRIVHAHGGVVDKSLGDGLLCFFGYDYTKTDRASTSRNHAEQALAAAWDLQHAMMQLCMENYEKKKSIHPIRIGINTASVYIGDLGDQHAIDFALIGHGVNFAKRLEEGCEIFRILVGGVTKDLIGLSHPMAARFSRRNFKMKHHADTIEAYEINPFLDAPELIEKATRAYQESVGYQRLEQRWLVPENVGLSVQAGSLQGHLIDFSINGFSVRLDRYLARSVDLTMTLVVDDPAIRVLLAEKRLQEVMVEVRWGKVQGHHFIHGMLIKNLTPEQRSELFSILRQFVGEVKMTAANQAPIVTPDVAS